MATIEQSYDPAVPIESLIEDPDNPRRGNETIIDQSMAAHGFFGAVIAQVSTRRIIAGNHRTRVARNRGEPTVPVLWLDVDDDQARRIGLIENRSNDLAGYDNDLLGRILSDLAADGGLAGTGFDDDDLARLVAELDAGSGPEPVGDGDVRVLTLVIPAAQYPSVLAALDRLAGSDDAQAISAAVVELILDAAG